ncbi:epoxide hydrolase [Colletotrichum tabaci]|uniref:Epoxide hydrolase n=1 Tax=Colletotrichum tabaci TaxID=1209068 RepID=A0AAV9SV20_9PEZI
MAQEKRINSFPNFKLTVNDMKVVWIVSQLPPAAGPPPVEVHSGHVALPRHRPLPASLGLSGGPLDIELTVDAAAWLLNRLMIDLGFNTGYVAQGGDIKTS